MKLGFGRAKFENLDKYLAAKDYDKALLAVAAELRRNPSKFNLLLRQAEILGLAGDKEQAISVYSSLAEKYARDGFYAKAMALYNKVLKLDPSRDDVHAELARLIEEDKRSSAPLQERLKQTGKFKKPGKPEPDPAAEPAAPTEVPAQAVEGVDFVSPEGLDLSEEEVAQQEKERQASQLFSSFDEAALEEILSCTAIRSFEEGDIIVTEGEEGSSLFLIVSGRVKVFTRGEKGEALPLAELTSGDFFGEVSLLTGKPRTATITAKEPVTVVELGRENVDHIAKRHPNVHTVLNDFYNRRAQETVEAVIRRMREES
jgi:cAMP-dependent protein kinase regulator